MTTENGILDHGTSINNTSTVKEKIPNSSGILTLGILSIVLAGGVGIILGIISLGLTGGALRTYRANPERYTEGSLKNVNAGKSMCHNWCIHCKSDPSYTNCRARSYFVI